MDETNEIFGKYELLEHIGTGGMAEVYKAASTSIGGFRKEVALKRILPRMGDDGEFVSLFIDEAKLTVALNHSNIVQVFDFGRVDDTYYIALEYVDGRDLTGLLIKQSRRKRYVPVDVGCYIIAKTLLGLQYAHTRAGPDGKQLGIVHRDVSPHNILVSFDGAVKLTDFGVAKARNQASLTRPGVVLGKFAYMSPEQAQGHEIDPRSDVYSAGVALYETLTGRRLFYSEDPAKTLEKVRNPNVKPPSNYNPNISPELDKVCLTALAPEADARYQSARDFSTALSNLIASDFSEFSIAYFMRDLFEDEVGPEKFTMAAEHHTAMFNTKPAAAGQSSNETIFKDAILGVQADKLAEEPNLWNLVVMGDRMLELDRKPDAVRIYRLAGTKFAQNGLLVQSLSLFVQVRELAGWSDAFAQEIRELNSLAGLSNRDVFKKIGSVGDDDLGQLLRRVLLGSEPSGVAGVISSPLFSFLDPEELVNLVSMLHIKRIKPGTRIIQEGETEKSLYIIAKGRVIIYCHNYQRQKVYLSSLTEGDCVGEFSFFTRKRRAATVETLDEVMLFEMGQEHFDELIEKCPTVTNAILRFYKQRVVAMLLAKSEIFGVLPAPERTKLLEKFEMERRVDGDIILNEGEETDGFYLIKSGEVEVYSDKTGYLFFSKLKSGDFFGEMSALSHAPRSASVRSLGDCELLRLPSADLQTLIERHPEMTKILKSRIDSRNQQTNALRIAGDLLI